MTDNTTLDTIHDDDLLDEALDERRGGGKVKGGKTARLAFTMAPGSA